MIGLALGSLLLVGSGYAVGRLVGAVLRRRDRPPEERWSQSLLAAYLVYFCLALFAVLLHVQTHPSGPAPPAPSGVTLGTAVDLLPQALLAAVTTVLAIEATDRGLRPFVRSVDEHDVGIDERFRGRRALAVAIAVAALAIHVSFPMSEVWFLPLLVVVMAPYFLLLNPAAHWKQPLPTLRPPTADERVWLDECCDRLDVELGRVVVATVPEPSFGQLQLAGRGATSTLRLNGSELSTWSDRDRLVALAIADERRRAYHVELATLVLWLHALVVLTAVALFWTGLGGPLAVLGVLVFGFAVVVAVAWVARAAVYRADDRAAERFGADVVAETFERHPDGLTAFPWDPEEEREQLASPGLVGRYVRAVRPNPPLTTRLQRLGATEVAETLRTEAREAGGREGTAVE